MTPFEIIYVETLSVSCDGGGGALGHPKVYMNLSKSGQVECGYCSRLFVHQSKAAGQSIVPGVETIVPAPKGLDPRVEGDRQGPVAPSPTP